jgi:hypothetical protein
MAPLPTGTALHSPWQAAGAGRWQGRTRPAPLNARVAEFLVEKSSWQPGQLNRLPAPRVDALQEWQAADLRQAIEQISYSAHLVPP